VKTISINFEGQDERAEEMSFETEREGWSNYALEDGTVLKMKNVVSRIFRLLDKRKPDGAPIYVLEGTAVVTTLVPDSVITVSSPAEQPQREH
jgi:hypothetical protein